MSTNPLEAKIAAPYARALYDFSVEQNIMHQITADFQNLESFLQTAEDLTQYLNNPLVSTDKKREILERTLKSELNAQTFKFLLVLVDRDRINLLEAVIDSYLQLVYRLASIKMVEVSTAFAFTNKQKNLLIKKLNIN
jgi:F-type H+-transporting ATPase subunit delta